MGMAYIAVGGALGALARYALSGWVQGQVAGTFPWGTLAVNVLGSFCLGFLLVLFEGLPISVDLRRFVSIGILGAFTTFSTFTYETAELMQDGDLRRGAAYALGSLFLGLVAVFVGFALASVTLHRG